MTPGEKGEPEKENLLPVGASSIETACPPIPQSPTTQAGDRPSALQALREEIGDCRRCGLCAGRSNIVFGEGSPEARIMFIGEAPGREEDNQGRPFVGEAGQLLTRLIEKMGFQRGDVYIANIVKCRPPENRDPHGDEIAACLPFLRKQIEICSPEVIVSLGKIATHTLLGLKESMARFSITKTRGRFYEYQAENRTIPLMPTFHPAYLIRNPKEKWLTWEDALAVLKRLGM
ncbi:MAG: uracil-DNA glycosylase [Nitrospirales bacterium]|nr:uracil-DNA glycosylase [Nitrospirales bacterium]